MELRHQELDVGRRFPSSANAVRELRQRRLRIPGHRAVCSAAIESARNPVVLDLIPNPSVLFFEPDSR